MRNVFYAHGGSKNHGCEAIIRSTVQLLSAEEKKFNQEQKPILLSYHKEEDLKYGLDHIVEVRQEIHPVTRRSFDFVKAYFNQKCRGDYHLMDALMHKQAIMNLPPIDAAFFVGGDNYCYSDVKNYIPVNRFMRKKARRTILWGASVEPKLLRDKEIVKDLHSYDKILARESISFEALCKVNTHTTLLPDPAFFLPTESIVLPDGFKPKKTIGINVSPMAIEHEKKQDMTMANYRHLIEFILKETDEQIAMIPHVVWDSNDDRKVLQMLYNEYKSTGRVLLVGDHNCMQQKYLISQCSAFVGARTHATIAAYSTGVPTLVVGYSVKARGIAKDLFGTYQGYVLPVQKLESERDLTKAFRDIFDRGEVIHAALEEKMNDYQKQKRRYLEVLNS